MARRRTAELRRGAEPASRGRGRPSAPASAAVRAGLPGRLPGLDALRGVAIVAMIGYHFCFDLRWFGLARFDFEHDSAWIAARSIILGTFLLVAGMSLVLASRAPDFARRFVVHVAQIAAAALLVSIGSLLAFPQTWIWFGVLHAIAVSLLIAVLLVRQPRLAVALGVVIVAVGVMVAHPAFDAPPLQWVGLMTHKPATEDYVPLLPWTGLVLLGVGLGHGLAHRPRALDAFARLPRALRLLGRHSLLTYLVHQPLLLALLWLATRR